MMTAVKRSLGGIEAAIRDVAASLASRWKLLSALALAVFAAVTALVLLLPPEYDKTVSLAVTPRVGELQQRLGQREPLERRQVANTALGLIGQARFEAEDAVATYNASRETVDVTLQSRARASLQSAADDTSAYLEEAFQREYETYLTDTVETSLVYGREQILPSNRNTLAQLDRQIEETRRRARTADPATAANASSALRSLEKQRQGLVVRIEQKEDDLVYLEDALGDMGPYADEAVEVTASSQSETRRIGPSSSPVVAAALLSVVAAVAVVLRTTAEPGLVPRLRRRETRGTRKPAP
ncbi:hypothetical protein GBA65_03230 [Rubrobacter marinus]|uniref:Polysaccharide chain length determinant N-terminal domain-containing protein n=1 Tax=Rubrobacter marinus TaxID=2653852 RepID=A0A6G8PUI2_9ACTN|nr:hypothetical protein [Rubrobacter marinus]QIN77686.1 hypothetical protein GBA65_03230 [Rubrobacter marinus]